MAKLKDFFEIVNTVTGSAARHNHALKELRELLDALREFLGKYSTPDDVFKNMGVARTEVTTLIHQIRVNGKTFRNIKAKRLMPLIRDVYSNLENVRVDIYNPQKGKSDLTESLSHLNDSFQALADVISGIEYR
ncbi:hypothetical protein ACFLXF_01650 [Chloroflexota bacterium]